MISPSSENKSVPISLMLSHDCRSSRHASEYKIGDTFGHTEYPLSGQQLGELLNRVDELRFLSQAEKHENGLPLRGQDQEHGQRCRKWGRVLHATSIDSRHHQSCCAQNLERRIDDPTVIELASSCEAYEYLKASKYVTVKDVETLQKRTSSQRKRSRWRM